jgi:hypothetical protein
MWRRLGVQRGERTLFAWGAACLLLLGFADASVKNASETLFVKRVGPEVLPAAILLSSLVLVATTALVARLAARPDRTRLLPALLIVLAGALVPLWLLIHGDVRASAQAGAAALFIVSKELQSLGLLAFLLALGDLVHPRQAKRLLAPLLAALTLGAILGSFASRPLGTALGIAGLLPVAGGLLLAAAACGVPLVRVRPPRLGRAGRRAARAAAVARARRDGDGSLARLWRESRLFRLLAGVTAANALLAPMLYVQFQFAADLATQGSDGEARLLAINSAVRGWINVGILAIQLGVASRLFRRIGLPLSTALSPLVYLLGFLGLSFRLDLAVAMSAMASTRLVDTALFDPALRVLYSLFHERVRPRASALLEGPIKRGAGAAGAALTQGAIALAGAGVIAVLALPLAVLWCALAAALWRSYPRLLIQAAGARGRRGERLPVQELLDQATGRALARELASSDPDECRAAIELVSEADPVRAVASLARAARYAPDATRGLLVESLDRLLEQAVADPVGGHAAAQDLAALLAQPGRLAGLDRANVVQAFGRLAGAGEGLDAIALLEREAADPSPAVHLAAKAALARRGGEPPDAELASAAREGDAEARQIAREELRALLVQGDPEADADAWRARLRLLAEMVDRPEDRAAACEALADVARRHGERAAEARTSLLGLWDEADPRVRAAVLRFAGHAGLRAQARRIVAGLDAAEDAVAGAAEEALRALGHAAADVLLVELSFGRRSRHEGVFRLLRDLEVEEKTLRTLFERELGAVRQALVQRGALAASGAAILLQRLDERVEEGVQTALSILAALRGDDALAELAAQLQRTHDVRRRAILLEALVALLEPGERAALLPLLDDRPLEDRAAEAARGLGAEIPAPDLAIQHLAEDGDELTRDLARAALRAATAEAGAGVAPAAGVGDHAPVLDPVEIALYLKRTPLFEGLSTRHLIDLASVVREVRHPAGAVLMAEDQPGSSLYLIVDGRVRITRGERVLAEIGPEAFLGEVGLLEGARRTATATSVTPLRVLRLERDDLLSLMEEIPAIAIRVAQELSRRYRQVMEQMVE